MFAKGPRFQPDKPNDVPGPGAYNPQEGDTHTYKRGAFLEKSDRFAKDMISEGPGPNAYMGDIESRPPIPSLAVIRQKLDALKITLGKDRGREIQKLQHYFSCLEARNNDLNKERVAFQASSSQAERELRLAVQRESALKTSLEKKDADLTRLHTRAGDYMSLRRALDSLDAVHKESKRQNKEQVDKLQAELERRLEEHTSIQAELKALQASSEYERKCHTESSMAQRKVKAELEDVLKTEGKKLEAALTKLRATCSSSEKAAQQNLRLQSEVFAAKEERDTVQFTLNALKEESDLQRSAMQSIATAYGNLASHSVPATVHHALKYSNACVEMESARLERKYVDRSCQVTELAQMIRDAAETNSLLRAELDIANEEINHLRSSCRDLTEQARHSEDLQDLQALMMTGYAELLQCELEAQTSHAMTENIISQSCRAHFRRLLSSLQGSSGSLELVEKRAGVILTHALTRISSLEEHTANLESSEESKDLQLSEQSKRLQDLLLRDQDHERQIGESEVRLARHIAEAEQARVAHAVQMKSLNDMLTRATIAEKNLESDVADLDASLRDAIKFQEAHNALLKQVDILVSRNVLAEEEAEHLSKFNAQILGHTNTRQRIYYVDRLRKEMSEVKQELITAEWERNALKEENTNLRRELGLYEAVKPVNLHLPSVKAKDASVPPPSKMTRVDRIPLASRTINLDWQLESSLEAENPKGKQLDPTDWMSVAGLSRL